MSSKGGTPTGPTIDGTSRNSRLVAARGRRRVRSAPLSSSSKDALDGRLSAVLDDERPTLQRLGLLAADVWERGASLDFSTRGNLPTAERSAGTTWRRFERRRPRPLDVWRVGGILETNTRPAFVGLLKRFNEGETNMSPAKKELDLSIYQGRFAARLRELREKAGLSQVELAERLNVPRSNIARWETAANIPALKLFPALANALKLKKTKDLLPNE